MRRASVVGVMTIAIALCGAAFAPAAWRWTRTFVYQGAHSTAHGKTCSQSRFSDWTWHGHAHIGSDTYSYTWIEPIRRDGRHRHLRFTDVQSTGWSHYSSQTRRYLKQAVITELNKTRVGWFEQLPGHEYLEYFLPGGGTAVNAWHPHQQAC